MIEDCRMPDASHVSQTIPPGLELALKHAYEEVMWLASRDAAGVTPGMAREWYAGIRSTPLRRQVRQFTGRVSRAAASAPSDEQLHREHHLRMRSSLTQLIERHLHDSVNDPSEFVRAVVALEQVDIVTKAENRALQTAKGDPRVAEVEYVDWNTLPLKRRTELWAKMLRNHVLNAVEFDPRRPSRASSAARQKAEYVQHGSQVGK